MGISKLYVFEVVGMSLETGLHFPTRKRGGMAGLQIDIPVAALVFVVCTAGVDMTNENEPAVLR
jgi:hypothetical protein